MKISTLLVDNVEKLVDIAKENDLLHYMYNNPVEDLTELETSILVKNKKSGGSKGNKKDGSKGSKQGSKGDKEKGSKGDKKGNKSGGSKGNKHGSKGDKDAGGKEKKQGSKGDKEKGSKGDKKGKGSKGNKDNTNGNNDTNISEMMKQDSFKAEIEKAIKAYLEKQNKGN